MENKRRNITNITMETGNLADDVSRGIKNSLNLETPFILQKKSYPDVVGKLTLPCPYGIS